MMTQVTVEFFGIPRQRAGCAEMTVEAVTVGDALAAIVAARPALDGLVQPDGRVSPHYLVSIDGLRFVRDLREEVPAGSRVLLLSADAGG